jgi:putative transposase
MGRPLRVNVGGIAYHVLNRANARLRIFFDDADFLAFEKIMEEAVQGFEMRLLAYAILPNHWHMVLWPRNDGDLSRFVGWLTLTHTQRWHAHRKNAGTGHLYQGRFKSFPIQEDGHLRTVCRYVERNPLGVDGVKVAQDWRWSSLWRRVHGSARQRSCLSDWPVTRGHNWTEFVNSAQTPREEAELLQCIARGRPFGEADWQRRTAARLGLESTLRPRGRPKLQAGPIV